MEKIKAVLLDVDNTILDFNICAKVSMQKVFSEFGLAFKEEMFPVFLKINGKLWEEIEKGTLKREDLYKVRWKLIFEALGMEGPDPVQLDESFRKYIAESAEPVEGAYALLKYLSKKYILCIASNASHQRQVKRLTNADMMQYIVHLFSSEEIGHPKPEKKFFDACMARLPGVKREETVVIGDSLTADIAGGKENGMKTIWFNYNKEAMPKNLAPDYTVESLSEIQNIL